MSYAELTSIRKGQRLERIAILSDDGVIRDTCRTVRPDREYSDMEIHANGLQHGRNLPFNPSIRPSTTK